MLITLCHLLLSWSLSQNLPPKVFDVHIHGAKDPVEQLASLQRAGVYAAAISSSWDLQQSYRAHKGPRLLQGLMLPCPLGKVPYSRQPCFSDGKDWPALAWIEQQIKEKKIDFIGEVLSQYYGISSSDTSLYPYYALAAKYNLPVGIHTGSAGPDHGSPNFTEAAGNPSLMREMLQKFPTLRVWVMHAGAPFLKEAIDLMKAFPNVYSDISAINNPAILPPAQFSGVMKALMEAGLEDRIMFGSDNGDIQTMIASVDDLTFLNAEQKEKIFYKNAERFFSGVSGQPISSKSSTPAITDLNQKLDSIFRHFNRKGSPGIAVTVLKDGKPLAKKAYGLASLEFNIPFSHDNIVRLPYAETREFISIAAAIMEAEGLLSFTDKVIKYFPKLPAWSEPVTIQHLLNHSSGFEDEWAALLLTQSSMANRFDQSQFLDLLFHQPQPGFEPGKGYMYCNSDFGLLRLILEKASGENLRVWMKKKLFDPNGMGSTLLHDNKNQVIPLFAMEYDNYGLGYNRWISDKTSPGGNYHIATSAADLEKWYALHENRNSPVAKAIVRLKKDATLMPGLGNSRNYVFGLKERVLDKYQVILHQGVNDRPYLSRVTEEGLAIIILGNTGAPYPQFHKEIIEYMLVGETKSEPLQRKFLKGPVKYSLKDLEPLAGRYFEEDTIGYESYTKDRKQPLYFVIDNDSLKGLYNGMLIPMEMISPWVFKDPDYEAYLEFTPPKKAGDPVKIKTLVNQTGKIYHHLKDTTVIWKPSKEQLRSFTGTYYSPHLDFYWRLVMNEDGKLIIKRPTIADTELTPETPDLFTLMVQKGIGDSGFEVFVRFKRNSRGEITELIVSDPRLMGHRFMKVPDR
ncbi:serine hydrolase [Flavihumibacter sp.]|uniref:serine hydrolase n=1 Tax=Flavihumibacter sp. TaxID=1913981 RepID=UPI002FC643FF